MAVRERNSKGQFLPCLTARKPRQDEATSGVDELGTGDDEGEGRAGDPEKGVRPRHSARSTRKKLARSLPKALDALIEKAENGSITHLRLMMQMSGLDKGGLKALPAKKREKSLEQILKEAWREDAAMGPREDGTLKGWVDERD